MHGITLAGLNRAQGGDFCRTSIIMLANCNLKRPNAVALRHQQGSCQVLKRFWWQGFTSLRLFKRCYSIAPKLAKSKNAFCVSQGLTHYTGSVYKMNRLMGDSLEGTTAMSAALGGTISSLSGGSFTSLRLFKRCYSIAPKLAKSKNAFCQNGAMTAAFAHLYNDLQHRQWVYSQSTGEMTGPDGEVMQGYSGYGYGLNNPDMQDVADVGPIPRGQWEVTDYRNILRGKAHNTVVVLSPLNVDTKRTDFLIHGGYGISNPTASQGCIVIEGAHNRSKFKLGDRIDVQ